MGDLGQKILKYIIIYIYISVASGTAARAIDGVK